MGQALSNIWQLLPEHVMNCPEGSGHVGTSLDAFGLAFFSDPMQGFSSRTLSTVGFGSRSLIYPPAYNIAATCAHRGTRSIVDMRL